MNAKDQGFRGRLAYLLWLWSRGRRKQLTAIELGDRLGWNEGFVSKWRKRITAPPGGDERDMLDAQIGVAARRWLYTGEGEPIEPAAWAIWSMPDAVRSGRPATGQRVPDPRLIPESTTEADAIEEPAATRRDRTHRPRSVGR